jgi:hypothetical protein
MSLSGSDLQRRHGSQTHAAESRSLLLPARPAALIWSRGDPLGSNFRFTMSWAQSSGATADHVRMSRRAADGREMLRDTRSDMLRRCLSDTCEGQTASPFRSMKPRETFFKRRRSFSTENHSYQAWLLLVVRVNGGGEGVGRWQIRK